MNRRLIARWIALAAVLAPAVARAAGGGEKKKSGGGSYLPVQSLQGATLRPGGRRGVLSVDLGLDVPDTALRTRAEQSIPRLRAAYLQSVQSYAAGLAHGAAPSADYLGQTLQRQTDAVLGKPGAKVLLGSIIVN